MLKCLLIAIVIATVKSEEFCTSADGFCEVGPTADNKCCWPNVCNANKRYGYCQACISNGNLCSKSKDCCDNDCDLNTGRCVSRPQLCASKNAFCQVGPTSDNKCCWPYICNTGKRYGYCNKCASEGNFCSRDDDCCDRQCDRRTGRCTNRR
ncbi:hypothetical protein Ciccas_012943 [Cichlidogyrus casuarinus]|uniref:Uncharacterized protein n=1 Tax=Cichlidogyrus casuarinus TaxID=1844966 RepID=A0ABD2PS00_9PLAT